MITYITKDGDTADYIAWKHYGTTGARVVEQLLEANKGLADSAILSAGIEVVLPEISATEEATGVKLWD